MQDKDYDLFDKVKMKKIHPCGNDIFLITRMGADIKIKCEKCERVVMLPRAKFEKGLKKVVEKNEAASKEKNS